MRSRLYLFSIVWALFLAGCGVLKRTSKPTGARAEIRIENKLPTLYVDGDKWPPFAYMSYLGEKQYYREMAEAGLHLFNIPAYLGDRGINSTSGIGVFRKAIWQGEGQYDFSTISADFNEILSVDPSARIIIRLHLDPPEWWERTHPDEVSLQPDGTSIRTSFASMKWRHDAGEVLRNTVDWLLESPYAPYLVGIHVAGGYTEEWFYHYSDFFYDESPARLKSFRIWLRDKYGADVEMLRTAWGNQSVTFETAWPEDISGKNRDEGWRDTAADQSYFDTFDFHAGLMAEHIMYFCDIVKDASAGRLLTGAFYGYHYFVTDPRRGHGALAKLLDFPNLDYLSSPNDYHRVAGEDWAPFAAIKSVQLHGKLWLAENDTRTSITTLLKDRAPDIDPPGDWYSEGVWVGPEDMETSVSFLWKNLGRMLAYGYGGWWFDMWGGWFSDPQLMEVIQKGQELYKKYPAEDDLAMHAEVAVVVDERLQFWDKSLGRQTAELMANRYALGKCGVPYDLYLRTDLDKVKLGRYKAVWLLGIRGLTDEEQRLADRLVAHGNWLLFSDGNESTLKAKDAEVEHYPKKNQWSAKELGELWERAGVHRYNQQEDVVYAGRGWLCVHSEIGGKRILSLPFPAQVIDVISGDIVKTDDGILELDVPPGGTRLFRVNR
ncbi:beta-galactosidase [Parapedobacter sp.]